MIILIHPPVAKPCEPPAGIAQLAGSLGAYGIDHDLLDANLEGLLHLLDTAIPSQPGVDVWTKRAFRNRNNNLSAMRAMRTYENPDRYGRAVRDLNKVMAEASPAGVQIGLADYEADDRSPLRSADLLQAAEQPERNPFYPYFSERIRQLFEQKKPSAAGISLNYLSQAFCAFSMAGFIRREFPGVRILMGGGLITSWTRALRTGGLFSGLVDDFVSGPGEEALLRLIGRDPADATPRRPDYTALPSAGYLSPGFILPYSASTGCYWNRCDFCPEKAEGSRYAVLPPARVIDDLKTLIHDTRPSLIHLLDNAISPALLEALCRNNIGAPWYGFARVSSHLADPAFCRQLKEAGCVMLKLGIESGDQEVLDRLDKGISVDMASTVLRNLKNAGIATYVYLLFGTPVETETSAMKTLDFTVRHHACIDFLNLAIFNMPASGDCSGDIETRDFSDGDLSLYTGFVHPHGWDRKKVRLFLDRTFTRNPAVSPILKKNPPVFTSNHAPFFVMNRSQLG